MPNQKYLLSVFLSIISEGCSNLLPGLFSKSFLGPIGKLYSHSSERDNFEVQRHFHSVQSFSDNFLWVTFWSLVIRIRLKCIGEVIKSISISHLLQHLFALQKSVNLCHCDGAWASAQQTSSTFYSWNIKRILIGEKGWEGVKTKSCSLSGEEFADRWFPRPPIWAVTALAVTKRLSYPHPWPTSSSPNSIIKHLVIMQQYR